MVGAGAAERGGDLLALGRGGGGEALADLAPRRVDLDLAAGLGVDQPDVAHRRSSCSRGSRISTAITPWRRAQRAHRALPVARAAEVRDDDDEAAGAGERGRLRDARRRPRSRRRRRRSGSRAQLGQQPEQAERGPGAVEHPRLARRRRRARRAGCRAASRRGRWRAPRPRRRRPCAGRRCRSVIEAETSSSSQRVSARSPTCTRTCGSLHARGHVPVDVAHVVARAVRAGSSPARCRRRPAA